MFGKKTVFCLFVDYLTNAINICFIQIFAINENIIQKNNNKNIKYFGKNVIYIILEISQYIR